MKSNKERIEASLARVISPEFVGKLRQVAEAPEPLRLAFPGGAATVQKPTRDALLLSAKQWANAARERAHDAIAAGTDSGADMTYIIGCLAHVERILLEAGAK